MSAREFFALRPFGGHSRTLAQLALLALAALRELEIER
jgi:hypothetical protein